MILKAIYYYIIRSQILECSSHIIHTYSIKYTIKYTKIIFMVDQNELLTNYKCKVCRIICLFFSLLSVMVAAVLLTASLKRSTRNRRIAAPESMAVVYDHDYILKYRWLGKSLKILLFTTDVKLFPEEV